MKRIKLTVYVSLLAGGMLGCSSADTPASSTSGISSLSNLPKATSAVASGSGVVLSSAESGSAATTGTLLKDFDDSSTWSGGGKSRPMCELGTMTREILREAASPDKTLCYVGQMQALNKFSSSISDGTYKYYTVTSNGSPMLRVKFKIVKDSNGAITTYEMFTCQYASSTYTQNEYLSQTISGSSAAITAKNIGSQSSGGVTNSWSSVTTVTGTINSSGSWTSKVIEAQRGFSYDGAGSADGSFSQKLTLTQGASTMLIDGYNKSSFYNSGKSGGAGTSTFLMRLYGKVQLLGASTLPTLAFGEGSAKAIMTFDGSDVGGGGLNTAVTAHWNGDTRATAGSSDYASDIASVTPRADDGNVSVSFTSDQTWNCSDTGSSSFSDADISTSEMTTLQSNCDSKFGFGSGEEGGSNACFSM